MREGIAVAVSNSVAETAPIIPKKRHSHVRLSLRKPPALFDGRVNHTGPADDPQLPRSGNIRDCTTAQLAYWYNQPWASVHERALLEKTARHLIERFSHTHVRDAEQLAAVLPLGFMHNEALLKSLLNALVTKIRDQALLDENLLQAVAQLIHYADKTLLFANDVLDCLHIVAERLNALKLDEPRVVMKGLRSVVNLLDAAMTLDVKGAVDPAALEGG